MLPAGDLMATTATGRVFAFGATVTTVRLVASRVGRDTPAAVRRLTAAALVRLAFSAAVAAALVDDGRLAVPLVAAFSRVVDVPLAALVVLVFAATRTLLARARRTLQRVTLPRRPRAAFTAARRSNKPFYPSMIMTTARSTADRS